MAIPDPQITAERPQGKARGVAENRVNVVSMKHRGVISQPEDRFRSKPAAKPFLLEHDILKVTNRDDVDWEFRWDRRKYLIKVGDTGYVPFPALVIKLGDPRSVDGVVTRFNTEDGLRGIICDRHESLTTLFAHYGVENENTAELVDFAPKVEVRTMEGDEVVTFPSQDPNMVAWPVPQAPQPGRENSDTRRLLDNLANENAGMRAELEDMRQMLSAGFSGQRAEAPPASTPPAGDDPDALAAALVGASVDQGPSSSF